MITAPLPWFLIMPIGSPPIIYLLGKLGESARVPRVFARPITRGLARPRWLSLAVLVAAGAALWTFAAHIERYGATSYLIGSIAFKFDGVSLLMSAISLALGSMVVLASGSTWKARSDEEKYFALVVAMVGTIIAMSTTTDLFNLWAWFEALSIISYLLVVFYRERPASLEAGVKYLIQGSVGSLLVLIATSLVLAEAGTLEIVGVAESLSSSPIVMVACALFVIGYGVKIALVPLHTWLPDAHSQAPSGISAMLSGVVIEAGLIALIRVVSALAGADVPWGMILAGFGAINMLIGNLLALQQRELKRMLAYSSVCHVGYMLLGLGIGIGNDQLTGIQGGLFHLINHGLMKGLAFLAAGAFLSVLRLSVSTGRSLSIEQLSGASQRYPVTAFALALASLGLIGIPPLAGFMSKWQIFVAGIATGDPVYFAFVFFALLNSVLSLGYYLPLVTTIYRREASQEVLHGTSVPVLVNVPLVILATLTTLIGLWPDLVVRLTEPAGAAILVFFSG